MRYANGVEVEGKLTFWGMREAFSTQRRKDAKSFRLSFCGSAPLRELLLTARAAQAYPCPARG